MKRVFILFACAFSVMAQSTDLEKRLDEKISTSLAKFGAPSVSVAVVRDGRLFYAKAFGTADLESKRPATAQTRYAVGSISKQFTAAALLLLQEDGKLSLDDPVAKYYPNLTRAKEVTLRMLLSHTSGYEDYAPQDYIIPDWTRPTQREAGGWYFAAGELAMTPSDLAKWDIAFLQHKILSAKSYEEFTREVKLKNGDSTHYALGLSLTEIANMPAYSHGGEVSGFISSNTVLPTHNGAVVVLSNQDVINMVSPMVRSITAMVFQPEEREASASDTKQVKDILMALQKGKIDRSLFTENANSYFSEQALEDCKASLEPLGKLNAVTSSSENLRGGMIHRLYSADFEKKKLRLNIYLLPNGKFEQFLVEAE